MLNDRLADFAANSAEELRAINSDLDLFTMFKTNIDTIILSQGANLELSKFLDLQVNSL